MPIWAPSAVLSEEWGSFRIVVGGKRVTRFRGVETVVTGWSDQEPYGFGPGALVFPQITLMPTGSFTQKVMVFPVSLSITMTELLSYRRIRSACTSTGNGW